MTGLVRAAIRRHLERHRFPTATTRLRTLRASPIALALLRGEGFDPEEFRRRALLLDKTLFEDFDPLGGLFHHPPRSMLPPGVMASDRQRFARAFRRGFTVRDYGDRNGRLAVRACGRDLVEAEIGEAGAVMAFIGPKCRIRLPGSVPMSMVLALKGMAVRGVINHPLLRDCKSPITSVRQTGATGQLRVWFSTETASLGARVRVYETAR